MLPTIWNYNEVYEFKVVDSLATEPRFKELVDTVLGGAPPWEQLLSDEEKSRHEQLKANAKSAISLRIGVYSESKLIGFTYAYQSEGSNLHMAISCVDPNHQRRGIYSELLRAVLEFSKAHGFQTVDSHHRSTNNPVIIAKLRKGFVINGFSVSDIMGCLVQLTFYNHPERRKLIDVRSGLTRPDGLVRDLFF